jgi:hypothetical protein
MIDASKLKRIEDCKGRLKELVGNEGVIQLAKEGFCPHYIIINPITGEESLWFIPSEINIWFENNYINYVDGKYPLNYQFIHFNKDLHSAKEDIPDELMKISELYHLPFENMLTPPGIYFLCKGKKIKYIGQANNIMNRVLTHINEGLKDFDSVFFIKCPINKLTELESALIRYYRPAYNISCNVPAKEKDLEIIKSLQIK